MYPAYLQSSPEETKTFSFDILMHKSCLMNGRNSPSNIKAQDALCLIVQLGLTKKICKISILSVVDNNSGRPVGGKERIRAQGKFTKVYDVLVLK